jgi:hypothetical protein
MALKELYINWLTKTLNRRGCRYFTEYLDNGNVKIFIGQKEHTNEEIIMYGENIYSSSFEQAIKYMCKMVYYNNLPICYIKFVDKRD